MTPFHSPRCTGAMFGPNILVVRKVVSRAFIGKAHPLRKMEARKVMEPERSLRARREKPERARLMDGGHLKRTIDFPVIQRRTTLNPNEHRCSFVLRRPTWRSLAVRRPWILSLLTIILLHTPKPRTELLVALASCLVHVKTCAAKTDPAPAHFFAPDWRMPLRAVAGEQWRGGSGEWVVASGEGAVARGEGAVARGQRRR